MATQKPSSPVKASTQSFTEIVDIVDDIVVMKDNSASLVIEVGAVNSWLLSEEEQSGMVAAYASLLNSLSFPVQILVLSKKINVSSYLDYLARKTANQDDSALKSSLMSYTEFIKNIVKRNTVLERRFFFVVPFSPLELGLEGTKSKMKSQAISTDYIVSRAKTSLYPKRDNLVRLLSKVGLRTSVLLAQQLTELFYNLYNPSATGRKLAKVEQYTETILTS